MIGNNQQCGSKIEQASRTETSYRVDKAGPTLRLLPGESTGLSDQEMAESIRLNLESAAGELQAGDHERAVQSLQRAIQLKHQLWERLEPQARMLARRFAPYADRRASLTEGDLVSEAFLKYTRVVSRWDSGRGGSVWAWMKIILVRHFCTLGRRRRREKPHGNLDALPCERGVGSSTGRASRHEIEDMVDSLLAGDPQREQKFLAFKCYWFEGHTLMEVAGRVNVSLGVVHKWLTRLNSALGELFTDRA